MILEASKTSQWRWGIYFVAITMLLYGWSGSFVLDDAYITLHNARVLIQGDDPTYGVHPLVGATSPIHLALLALMGLAMPLALALTFLCILAAFAYVVALDAAVRKVGCIGWQVPALVLIGLLIGTVPMQMFNGLETGLAMATVAGLFALADNRRWLPVLAGLAAFVRPELGLLAAILLLRLCWVIDVAQRARALVTAFAIALPWLLWEWASTGHFMPATASAKMAFFAEGDWSLMARLKVLLSAFVGSALLPLIVGFLGINRPPLGTAAAGFSIGIVVIALAVIPGSLEWNHSRYLAPLVPALIVGVASFTPTHMRGFLTVALVLFTTLSLPVKLHSLANERRVYSETVVHLRMLGARLPPGSRVLIHDAGIISWTAPHLSLIDAVGLKTPSSVDWHRRYTQHACGWSKALDGIARTNQVKYAIVLQARDWECVGTNLREAGWKLTAKPSFGARYQLFELAPP